MLITKYGSLGNNEYLDPVGGIVVTYDHIKQVCKTLSILIFFFANFSKGGYWIQTNPRRT